MTQLEIARNSLRQCQAYQPSTVVERRARAANIAQLKAWITKAERSTTGHPSTG